MGGKEEKQEGHQKGFKVHRTGCPGTCHRECCGYQSALDAVCAAYGIYTSQLMEPHVIAPVKGTFPSLHQSWLNCLRSPVINFLTRTCQPTPVCLTVLSQLCTVTCLAVPAESCESQVFGVQASPLN